MTLFELAIGFIVIAAAYAVWQHGNTAAIATAAARRHCQQAGVQLLDQTVLLHSMAISRSPHSLVAFKRRFRFEFASLGDARYRGLVTLVGNRISAVELEPFKVDTPE